MLPIRESQTTEPPPSALESIPAAVPARNNGYDSGDTAGEMNAHPLAPLAGKYDDEPLWDDFVQAMQKVRCQMEMEEETTEQVVVHP